MAKMDKNIKAMTRAAPLSVAYPGLASEGLGRGPEFMPVPSCLWNPASAPSYLARIVFSSTEWLSESQNKVTVIIFIPGTGLSTLVFVTLLYVA